jgi:hypothetical protein
VKILCFCVLVAADIFQAEPVLKDFKQKTKNKQLK